MSVIDIKPPTERDPGLGIHRVPLRAADGFVRAHAIVDERDAGTISARSWHLTPGGYVMHSWKCNGKRGSVYLHREILGLESGDGQFGDHINRDRLDNRRSNLRILSPSNSPQNRSGYGRSRYRGVKRRVNRWEARAQFGGKVYTLGLFGSEIDAAAVAAQWRAAHMPAAIEDPELLARDVVRRRARSARASLSDEQVIDIRRRFLDGQSAAEIADEVRTSTGIVKSALRGLSYRDVPLLAEVLAAKGGGR